MRLDEAYQVLELRRNAPDEDVKRAWRDLSKVWHPDRFANDPSVQRRAEEKLKAINEAYETIRRDGGAGRDEEPWRTAAPRPIRSRAARYRSWSLFLAMAGLFILARRPTPGGLVIAVVLFAVTALLLVRSRRAR